VISRSRGQRLAHGKLWDAYCTFNDLHAMLAYVGAQDWRAARQLETALLGSQAQRSHYGETTRLGSDPPPAAAYTKGGGLIRAGF